MPRQQTNARIRHPQKPYRKDELRDTSRSCFRADSPVPGQPLSGPRPRVPGRQRRPPPVHRDPVCPFEVGAAGGGRPRRATLMYRVATRPGARAESGTWQWAALTSGHTVSLRGGETTRRPAARPVHPHPAQSGGERRGKDKRSNRTVVQPLSIANAWPTPISA